MTQAEFAKLLGLHKNTLGRYERGESEPDAGTARAVCTLFGVEPRWLLLGEGPAHADPAFPAPAGERETAGDDSRAELAALRRDNRELRLENRELRLENKELRKECQAMQSGVKPLLEELRAALAALRGR